MAQRSRSELQNLFKQGAKPSGEDFKDFIESTLNLKDDNFEQLLAQTNSISSINIEKLLSEAKQPLKIQAYNTDEKFIEFYKDTTNTWSINQKPTGANPGFHLFSPEGSRLFIEKTTGNVGIGTITPTARLSINGNLRLLNGVPVNNFSNDGTLQSNSSANVPTEQAVKAYVDTLRTYVNAVNASVGSTQNSVNAVQASVNHLAAHSEQRYVVKGTTFPNIVSPDGRHQLYIQNDRNVVLYSGGVAVWNTGTHASDINLKEKITPITQALSKLLSLRGISFYWRDKTLGDTPELGVIAQEVEQTFPELVNTLNGQSKFVKYEKFVPVLIEAIKEQQTLIAQLQQDLQTLKTEPKFPLT